MLDDITDKHYRGKTALLLGDDTRNALIKAYRDAQGLLYVPSSTHKAIRWSNKDPLLEAEIHNVSWHIANPSDKKECISGGETARGTKKHGDIIRTQKRSHNSVVTPEKHKNTNVQVVSPPRKIQRGLNPAVGPDGQGCNSVPKGFAWSDNSCAYDSALTILFSMWMSDNPHHEVFLGMTSNLARILQQTFQRIINDQDFE